MDGGPIKGIVEALMRPWVASCEETRERLSSHLEGELEGREERRVLRHLVRCERCREVLRSLARAVHGLQSLGRVNIPAPVPSTADAVVDRIRRDNL
jgi:predicted anti-sigma-YlaC factor YlaD